MIYPIGSGIYWSRIYPDKREVGGEWLAITDNFSMPFSGYCEQERHDEIYPPIVEIGKIHNDAFVAGETRGSGKSC